MKNHINHTAKSIFPFLGFSAITGLFTALVSTAFKLGAEWIVHLSGSVYGIARQTPLWIPVLIIGAALLGLAASFIVSLAQSCKGGGIPTSVAAVRGIVGFKWLQSVFVLPFSALVTFLGGVPLGTEGPCVQMGTAIGDGVAQKLGAKKFRGWRRYIMTGGAAAGFSIATFSPISAILFSVEELQKKFSPLLLAGVAIAVMTAYLIAELSGVEDFTDAVIEAKERASQKGATPSIVETTLTAREDSFLVGKKRCDVLWPNACVVVSVEHANEGYHGEEFRAGDMITLRYQTHDPAATATELAALAGEQATVC